MLNGKRLRLKKRALALELFEGQLRPVSIPAGASIEFTSGPTYDNGLANALWDTREVAIFLSWISRDEPDVFDVDSPSW